MKNDRTDLSFQRFKELQKPKCQIKKNHLFLYFHAHYTFQDLEITAALVCVDLISKNIIKTPNTYLEFFADSNDTNHIATYSCYS